MKISQNFQLTVFITMLGIPFLGQAAQVPPKATSAAVSTSLEDKIKQASNSVTMIANQLAQIQAALTRSPTLDPRHIQLMIEKTALEHQLTIAQILLKSLLTSRQPEATKHSLTQLGPR
jgi:hypothetical protein